MATMATRWMVDVGYRYKLILKRNQNIYVMYLLKQFTFYCKTLDLLATLLSQYCVSRLDHEEVMSRHQPGLEFAAK